MGMFEEVREVVSEQLGAQKIIQRYLTRSQKKLGKDITIIRPNGDNISLDTLCNSTKIDKKIPTKIIRV